MEEAIITAQVTKLNLKGIELTVTFKDSDDETDLKKIITDLLSRKNAEEIFTSDSHHL